MWFVLFATSVGALGAVRLDNYTYDKFISIPNIDVLVKFDKTYVFGEQEDQFKKLCAHAYSVPNFFVASVGIGEYGDKENDQLRQRFDLRITDLPHLKLYRKGELITYNGTLKEIAPLVLFLRVNGINISPFGSLPEFDSVVTRFVNTSDASPLRQDLLDECRAIAKTYTGNNQTATEYVKIMEKVQAKGMSYIEAESSRLTRLLNGVSLVEEQREKMSRRAQVLSVFHAYKSASTADPAACGESTCVAPQ